MSGPGTWGWLGEGNTLLEVPAAADDAVAPADRARLRYNRPGGLLEASLSGGDYEILGSVPAGHPFEFKGTAFDVAPTGPFTVDMAAGQAVGFTLADEMGSAMDVRDSAGSLLTVHTTAADRHVHVNDALAIGDAPAGAGALRLTRGEGIYYDDTAAHNARAMLFDAADELHFGDASHVQSLHLSAYWGVIIDGLAFLQIGTTNPADNGTIRLRRGASIRGRNQAQDNNGLIIGWGGADLITIGDSAVVKKTMMAAITDHTMWIGANQIFSIAATLITASEDFRVAGGKDLDCYTNGAYLKPRYTSQGGVISPDLGEAMSQKDTGGPTYYWVVETPDGTKKVALT